MSSKKPEKHTVQDYKIGIICALVTEDLAVTVMLDNEHAELATPSSDDYVYTLGSMSGLNVAIVCLPKNEIGTSAAAAAVSTMTGTFPSIKLVLMVGIAGGVSPM